MSGWKGSLYPAPDRWQDLIPCQGACPVSTDARGYVTAISDGDVERAYLIAREPNPFASICGRVCAAPCEAACRRGKIDEPVAIRALKRFVTERYGPEAGPERSWASRIPEGPVPSINDTPWNRRLLGKLRFDSAGERKIAVVGSGVAGMTCAHDLALLGYRVTVFEKQKVPGGMLHLGVPEYRLPRDLVRAEIDSILSLGVDLKLGTGLGEDFTLSDLRRDYDSVFLGLGATSGRDLDIEGADLDGVFKAVEFLLNVHKGFHAELGERVVVIGGGDVAMDAARTVLRQRGQPQPDVPEPASSEMYETLDSAREAIRRGAKEVHVICLESWEEMPAQKFEIEEALEEGITIHPRRGPVRIIGKSGQVTGIETREVISVFDADGRFNPTFSTGAEMTYLCDSVIMAVGQATDLTCFSPEDNLETTPMGTIRVDADTLVTSLPDVYAGGDAAFGPRIFIEAVENGHRAALSIHENLTGEKRGSDIVGGWMRLDPYPAYLGEGGREPGQLPSAWERQFDRIEPPKIPTHRRVGLAEVEMCYGPDAAAGQGERCLRCSVHPILSTSLCILCGRCVDVCPSRCFRIVSLDRLRVSGESQHLEKIRQEEDVPDQAVMVVSTDECIRCGLCSVRCPTGAIIMERFEFTQDWDHQQLP